ncbi:MAG: DUF2336 domain-containing protein, partial [Alphaproteobacteria bacterium]
MRAQLAARPDVRPEILYYLVDDESPAVRRALAANGKTPRQADRLLAEDADGEVRCDLAFKIGRLTPQLSDEQKDHLRKLALESLDVLAQDQLPRVRQIVAEEIKQCGNVPNHIVQRLARDVELIVAAPVLEYSPLLSDDDLLEIIASEPVQGALSAISRRESVAPTVSDAVAGSGDADAIAALLGNASAQIREETLDRIIDQAPNEERWHKPLVERPGLSVRAVRHIASFVALSLLHVLEKQHDLPPEAAEAVRKAVAQRIEKSGAGAEMVTAVDARALFEAGLLDDEAILDALNRRDHDFVKDGVALRSGLSLPIVEEVLASQSAEAVTALAWAAGLGMPTAIQMQ